MRMIATFISGLALVAWIASLAAQSAPKSGGDAQPAVASTGDLWLELMTKPAPRPTTADAKRLIGTWRIVSPTAFGILQYSASGYMSAQVATKKTRRPFARPEPTP